MIYKEEYIKELKTLEHEYKFLDNKVVVLSGGTGLIGSYLVDLLLSHEDLNVKLIILARSVESAWKRFNRYEHDKRLVITDGNLLEPIIIDGQVDYVIHAASLTDPLGYSLHPIDTMNINFIGVKNMLDLASIHNAKFLFVSSCEVYGKNETLNINENDYGYVDILDPRACYNESKRASETLCVCYKKEKNLEVGIARLSRVYGPTMRIEDTKALSQFIKKGLANEDIVLKSEGKQLFNYTYVSDVVRALLILLKNKNNDIAYNISSDELVSLKDIASYIASLNGKNVIFDIPPLTEAQGYSKSLVSSLNCTKFNNEFKFHVDVKLFDGIKNTIEILKE
ncbi:MAG: NAD-dependent epimerase/dehydratase family protein [Bacilli bacterium]|nr:NAD-dependent epimerase/dehydratase family protein [Bacilli bacterium]